MKILLLFALSLPLFADQVPNFHEQPSRSRDRIREQGYTKADLLFIQQWQKSNEYADGSHNYYDTNMVVQASRWTPSPNAPKDHVIQDWVCWLLAAAMVARGILDIKRGKIRL